MEVLALETRRVSLIAGSAVVTVNGTDCSWLGASLSVGACSFRLPATELSIMRKKLSLWRKDAVLSEGRSEHQEPGGSYPTQTGELHSSKDQIGKSTSLAGHGIVCLTNSYAESFGIIHTALVSSSRRVLRSCARGGRAAGRIAGQTGFRRAEIHIRRSIKGCAVLGARVPGYQVFVALLCPGVPCVQVRCCSERRITGDPTWRHATVPANPIRQTHTRMLVLRACLCLCLWP